MCAVVVTYGDRRHLLGRVLAAISEIPEVTRVVLVSNGAHWDAAAMAGRLLSSRAEVVRLTTNQGSATGFATGIRRSCELGAGFIWLLDDDNRPEQDALRQLLAAYGSSSAEIPEDSLAVAAFRPDLEANEFGGVRLSRLRRRRSSFWGLHVVDLPAKIWSYTPWGRAQAARRLQSPVDVDIAPYGGLLFRQALIERHGLPRADLVLYADDTEFTYRITHSGGTIRLVPSARITDIEPSWSSRPPLSLPFRHWLEDGGDVRAFYGARNRTYLDTYCWAGNPLLLAVNRQACCVGLCIFALALRRLDRYRLLRVAMREGANGRLGMHRQYPL